MRRRSTPRLGAMGLENPLTRQYAHQNAGRRLSIDFHQLEALVDHFLKRIPDGAPAVRTSE